MRTVKFKDFIPAEYTKSDIGIKQLVRGTNQYQKEFDTIGLFHKWGVSSEDRGDGYVSFNVALIEKKDGTVAEVRVDRVKFID
jgi:hypothetical protein